jgi:hypothetical protein
MFSNGLPSAPFLGFRCARPRPQTKGKRNAERRVVVTRARSARRALRSALASRRPTAALARETAGPQGSAPGHATGDSPERSILYGRPNRGAETLRFAVHDPEKWMPVFRQDHAPLAGVTRAGKTNETNCPRTASTSRAGHSAGRMMPDAARERVTNPPAGTALAPFQGVSSRRTSLRWASGGASTRRAGRIQEIPAADAIPLIHQRIISRCLFDSPRGNCDIAAMIRSFCAKMRRARTFLNSAASVARIE